MGLQRSGADRTSEVQPGAAPPKLKFKRGADGDLEIDRPGETPDEPDAAPPDDGRDDR